MIGSIVSSLRNVALVGLVLVALAFFFGGSGASQTADLGQVLDRTEFAISQYESFAAENDIRTLDDAQVDQFTGYLTQFLNAEPRFHDETIGMALQPDASYLGFADANANMVQDEGEARLFTIEIDGENKRLIATDDTGGAHMGISGSGLLAGVLLGNLMGRQSAAGVRPGAFNTRQTSARAAYRAPSSARSRARSGGFSVGK